jgi:hypothetical protein
LSDVRNCRGATRQQNQELIVGSSFSGPSTKKNTVLRVVLGLISSRGALAAGRTAPGPSLLLCVLYLSSTHNEGPPTVDAAAGWKWKKLGPVATHSFSGGTPLEHFRIPTVYYLFTSIAPERTTPSPLYRRILRRRKSFEGSK